MTTPVPAGNWPQWRGPNGDGFSDETGIPFRWGPKKNVVWKTRIPGVGHSSPIVWGEAIFLTTAQPDSEERQLLKINVRTGNVQWQRTAVTAPYEHTHRENSYASSTPATDGRHVFVSFQDDDRVNLQCYDFSGNKVWEIRPLSFKGEHGYCYSPILYKDLILFDCSQNGESVFLGIDKATGTVRWRFDKSGREISHLPPLIVHSAGKDQAIVSGSSQILSIAPETGDVFWSCRGPTDVCVTSLVFGNDLVFATGGYPARTRMAVRTTGSGNVTDTHIVWSSKKAVSYVPSPIFYDNHIYTIVDNGVVYCLDAADGHIVWEKRIGGRHRASLVFVDGKLLATNDKGVTTVFRATPEGYEQIAANDLGEFCYATPAVADGRMYIRTENHLYCIADQ
jgi:hypothetical protein